MMTRTAVYKAMYVVTFAAGLLLIMAVCYAVDRKNGALALVLALAFVLMLLPGRIQARFWSELLAGLHQLNELNYRTSKAHSERFLAQLAEKPWLKRLIWLGTSIYSRDVEVLARNNLGVAMQKLGESDAAKEQLSRAIALDPKCPLPYRNMGLLLLHSATSAEAKPWFEKAQALGFRDDWADRLVMASQTRNAARTSGAVLDFCMPFSAPPALKITGAFVLELLNDDRTTMEFVVTTLKQVFGLTGIQATGIMLAVHKNGSAACAGFDTEAAAQTKGDEVIALARASDFPLACRVVAR